MTAAVPVVHLVDDDPFFLAAAARLLRAHAFPVLTFDSAQGLLAQVDASTRGCVVADLHMPGASGLDLQDALARACPGLPVVFLTGLGDIASTVRAMRAGAEDFLEKRCPEAELVAAVRRALLRDARTHAERDRQHNLRAGFEALTGREREVLSQVLLGRMNKQIAAALGIHERTVKLHRTAITTKLNVHSVAELTRLAQAAGLIDDTAAAAPAFPKGQ